MASDPGGLQRTLYLNVRRSSCRGGVPPAPMASSHGWLRLPVSGVQQF